MIQILQLLLCALVAWLIYARLVVPYMQYARLKRQGVVFNTQGFPLFYDVPAMWNYGKKEQYKASLLHVIKDTNNLAVNPPIYAVWTPVKIVTYICRAELLEEVFVNSANLYTKDPFSLDMAVESRTSPSLSGLDSFHKEYPARRKVISSAFFKGRIHSLMKTVKKCLLQALKEIERKNLDTIDIVKFTHELQCKIMLQIVVGRDNSVRLIKWEKDDG